MFTPLVRQYGDSDADGANLVTGWVTSWENDSNKSRLWLNTMMKIFFLFFVAVACFCYSGATIARVHVCPCRPVLPCSAVLSRTPIAVRLWSRCGACDAHPLARITLLRRLRARSGNRRWLLLFLLCRFLLSPSSLEALLPFLILAFPDHVVKGPIDIDGIFDFVLWECEKFHGERVVCLTRVCSWRIGWLVGRLAGWLAGV